MKIGVQAPFRLDLTAAIFRRLSTNLVDAYDGGVFRRAIGEGRRAAIITVEQRSPKEVSVSLSGASDAHDARALVQRMLGTSVDLEPFYTAAKHIAWLAPLVAKARGVKPPCYPSVWEACVNSIVYQQISIYAAGAILRRVLERYAAPASVEGDTLRAFPGPEALLRADPSALRSLGMSVNKVASVRAIGEAFVSGEIEERALEQLPTEQIMESLTRIPGIGPWTAAVIALRGFGRLDVFPMNDSGVARRLKDHGDGLIDVDGALAKLGNQRGMLYYHVLLDGLAKRGDVVFAAGR